MMIHEVTAKVAGHPQRKRRGRGNASGIGGTSGRGHKGAKSRAGWSRRVQYDGGQINFIQKLPKRGFSNAEYRKHYHVINVGDLNALAGQGAEITIESLAAAGLVRDARLPLKVLGEGDVKAALNVTAAKCSASAKAKIEAAGGTLTLQVPMVWGRNGAVPDVPRERPVIDPAVAFKVKAEASAKPAKEKGEKQQKQDKPEAGDAKPEKQKKAPKKEE